MSAQRPRITRADIAETLQTVRDVAALTLTEPQWAEADAAASALADALARDDPEALQEALADLELLGPTRLALGDSARANLPVLRWHRDLVARRHARRSRPRYPGRPRTVRSIRDRDGKFPGMFDAILADAGIETVLTGVRMPRMNAYAERFVRTVRAECTDRVLVADERHLSAVLSEYIGHYNTGRSHQGDGMDQRAPDDPGIIAFPVPATQIRRRTRLAGLINEYRQTA